MKTKFAFAALALALTSASAFASDTGTVKFAGEVRGTSCVVKVGDNDANGATVKLETANDFDFTVNDTAVKPKNFTIKVSGCDLKSSVEDDKVGKVNFAWTQSANSLVGNNILVNSLDKASGGSSANLALFVGDATDTVVAAGVPVSKELNEQGEVEFPYTVAYVASDAAHVSGGLVQGQAEYTIIYN